MASRREFLQTGVAASILPVCLAAETSSSPALAPLPLYKVIFDRRFPASREFAAEARRLGLPIHGIEGDITDVWFHDLSLRWKQGPAAIAGLTAQGPLFCLERLAWDQQMRVVFRARHYRSPEGSIAHDLWGPRQVVSEAAAWSARPDWGGAVADVLSRCPQNSLESCSRTILAPAPRAADAEPLYSWVIAAKAEPEEQL